jgi:hypothetical protein
MLSYTTLLYIVIVLETAKTKKGVRSIHPSILLGREATSRPKWIGWTLTVDQHRQTNGSSIHLLLALIGEWLQTDRQDRPYGFGWLFFFFFNSFGFQQTNKKRFSEDTAATLHASSFVSY